MPQSDTAAARPIAAQRLDLRGGPTTPATLAVPVEAPLALHFGAVPYAVMMTSPADLEDFVTGFSITEGIVGAARDIRSIAFKPAEDGQIADIVIDPEHFRKHLTRQRNIAGRTSCGMCGITEIDDIKRAEASAPRPARTVDATALKRALTEIEQHQHLNNQTRSVHAAAWHGPDGALRLIREDVGRHNALDKLIGAMARAGEDPLQGFLLITSRCSFEMVEKAAIAGADLLVSISGPTSLAIDRARALGLNLVCIARADAAMQIV